MVINIDYFDKEKRVVIKIMMLKKMMAWDLEYQ